MHSMNRRTILAGAAAAAVPVPALALPVATHPDAELLALGEQIKELLPEMYRARQISNRLWKRARRAADGTVTGPPSQTASQEEWRESHARFKRASIKCGYHDANDRLNKLCSGLRKLTDIAINIPLRTPEGAAVKAMVTLLDEAEFVCLGEWSYEQNDTLWEIARLGGFPLPPWVSWRL